MNRVRVLVVEDSVTMRRRLVETLAADPGLEVVGEAADASAAIRLARHLRPSVITLDMVLGETSGLEVTEQVMAHFPTPILVVSASTHRGELFRTYDALAAGAVDVLEKPSGQEPDGEWETRLVGLVKLVSRIRVITHPRARMAPPAPEPTQPPRARGCRVVAVGASTGGPGAVIRLLRALPASFSPPVLLVIHIAEPFGASLAEWLAAQVPFRVRLASDGEPMPAPGGRWVIMAPPGRHLVTDGARLHLVADPPRHSCRPSVDVLFESVARSHGPAAAAALLTGMGRDGAAGLLAVRRAGGFTVAQDEASSVVFGMPGEAIALGAAAGVGDPEGIAAQLAIRGGHTP